jgi:hypothetical protein
LRSHKAKLFFSELHPQPGDSLLDIGGTIGMSNEFAPIYSFFRQVTTLNLESPPAGVGNARFVQGDARALPFPDHSFDWVFSNAVIEHVGAISDQHKMAKEIERVARKGYFIATPNKLFPVDPHSYLPLFHWLDTDRRKRLNATLLARYQQDEAYWMLTPKEMKSLFPSSRVRCVGYGTSVISIRTY